MRKLILQMQMSVDGFVAASDGNSNWLQWAWGPDWTWPTDLQKYHTNTLTSVDEVLLSDVMAEEGFIDHWAAIAQNGTNPEHTFAAAIIAAHKTIFARKPFNVTWDNVSVASAELAQEVRNLKQRPGKNMIAFGGVRFATALLREGLVDEMHLIVNPVALGDGLSIFKTGKSMRFALIDAKPYANGVVVLRYAAA